MEASLHYLPLALEWYEKENSVKTETRPSKRQRDAIDEVPVEEELALEERSKAETVNQEPAKENLVEKAAELLADSLTEVSADPAKPAAL